VQINQEDQRERRDQLELLLSRYAILQDGIRNHMNVLGFNDKSIHVHNILALEVFGLADGVFKHRDNHNYPWQFAVNAGGVELYSLYSKISLQELIKSNRFSMDEIKSALPEQTCLCGKTAKEAMSI
jgi:hypothetical protein